MKKVVALITVMAVLFQVLAFSVFAEPSGVEGFQPAIDVNEGMVETRMSEDEILDLYSEFKSKVENDRESQKEMIIKNQQKEKMIIEEAKKKFHEEIKENTSRKSITSSLSQSFGTSIPATSSAEIVNAPYDLDAEVINATVNGGHLILTWMPSEGADGYNVYMNGQSIASTATEKYDRMIIFMLRENFILMLL